MTHHDKALEEVQRLVYRGLSVKLMAGQLLIGHCLQALCEGVVLQHQSVLLLLDGCVVVLQLLLLLLQLLQLPAGRKQGVWGEGGEVGALGECGVLLREDQGI